MHYDLIISVVYFATCIHRFYAVTAQKVKFYSLTANIICFVAGAFWNSWDVMEKRSRCAHVEGARTNGVSIAHGP